MSQTGIQNLTGLIFAIVTENTFWSLFGVMGSTPNELPIIFREYQSGMFEAGPYYLAKAISLVSIYTLYSRPRQLCCHSFCVFNHLT